MEILERLVLELVLLEQTISLCLEDQEITRPKKDVLMTKGIYSY